MENTVGQTRAIVDYEHHHKRPVKKGVVNPVNSKEPAGKPGSVEDNHYRPRGALLPHHFTLTCSLTNEKTGGLISAALSVGLRLPGVTWHSTLWSPDFPP